MSSSARWPSGWTRRWAGSRGRVHRRPEGRAPDPARDRVSGAVGVSPAWFYKWRHGDPSPQHARREQLKVEIRRLFAKHRGTYGSPRITADLRDEGWRVSENTVAALMRRAGAGRPAQAAPQADHPAGPGPVAGTGPDRPRLRRRPAEPQVVRRRHRDPHRRGQALPGQRAGHGLTADRRVRPGRASRRRPGRPRRWPMAVAVRGGKDAVAGVILHTDQGSEYTAGTFRAACGRFGHHPVDGPGRVGAGQRGDRELALHRGVRAAPPRSTSPPRPRPAAGSRPGSRSTTTTGATPSLGMRLPDRLRARP